ncbi:LacI family DNA-binding transcriptional regulator [Arthrobacter sp. TWP1-1]|uniref:LacI family DNA-binding transcriptional regulator n=1 Tax=Arthrobacter sp. TWP1-1 TaxID=2804568 RepID=UPI003CED13C3
MPNVTITSLAQQLGISKASVSYALNGRSGVSDETRERVLALAAELGWYPSSSARALSHSRSETIGIVLLRDPAHVGSEPFYMSVLAGIEAVLGERDQNLMLRIVAPDAAAERRDLAVYRRWVGEGRVDGVLLFDETSNDPRCQLLGDLGLPFVLVGGTRAPAAKSAATAVDQSADAATVVEALHERGHRRIAYISGLPTLGHERARSAAVVEHAESLGISAVVTASDYTAADGEMATIALMAGLDPASKDFPTALFYGNDLMAVGGLAGLKKVGISVPEQVSVVSWDDSIMCEFSSPPVAALNRDIGELGRQSAMLLLDIIQGHQRENVSMPAGVLRLRTSLGVART